MTARITMLTRSNIRTHLQWSTSVCPSSSLPSPLCKQRQRNKCRYYRQYWPGCLPANMPSMARNTLCMPSGTFSFPPHCNDRTSRFFQSRMRTHRGNEPSHIGIFGHPKIDHIHCYLLTCPDYRGFYWPRIGYASHPLDCLGPEGTHNPMSLVHTILYTSCPLCAHVWVRK